MEAVAKVNLGWLEQTKRNKIKTSGFIAFYPAYLLRKPPITGGFHALVAERVRKSLTQAHFGHFGLQILAVVFA